MSVVLVLQYYHMAGFGKEHKFKNLLYSKFTILIILILTVFLGMSVYERFTVERDMSARRIDAETDLRELRERKEVLEEKVEYLKDENGIDAEIRKHFDVAKEGEQVIIIVDGEDGIPPLVLPDPSVEEKPWFKFW